MKFFAIFLTFGLFPFLMPHSSQKVFLIGDSTMANKKTSDAPETGWGQVFGEFFNAGVEIHNHAVNGRSTKSFRDKGHWNEVLSKLGKDDYVIIQFGHNDAKKDGPERFAEAKTDYKSNLIAYISEIKAKGAIPILATPVFRRKFDEKGTLIDGHGDYPAVVRDIAKSQNVDLLDMHHATEQLFKNHGPELSKHIVMHYPGGVFMKFPNGVKDDTHFSPYGAKLVAASACRLLMEQKHPLRNFLKKSVFPSKMLYELPQVINTSFRRDTFDITRYGAKSGIGHLNTSSIQATIENASNAGGGVVLIPSGLWVTGPIVLKSNVNLHLSYGALLQFSEDRMQYPIIETTWEGQVAYRCQAPISARNQSNIGLTGEGTIDGAGHVWKSVKRSKLTESQWKSLIKTGVNDGNTWYPTAASKIGHESDWAKKITAGKTIQDYESVRDFLRPNMVSFINCDVVLIDGPVFNNSPAWTLHPLMCRHTSVKNTTVINPWYGQNNDAIDLESCRFGILDNCTFDTGDDAITIKSGRDAEGRKRGIPTSDFIIKNTKVLHGHGGFVIGSEMSGGVHNMYVNNCTFLGTDIGLRFKTTRGRGGSVHDIYISDIHMTKIVGEAILFDMYYAAKDPIALIGDESGPIEIKAEPVTEATPEFRDFYMENIYCNGAKTALAINGLPEMNVKNIQITNAGFVSEKGISINDANEISLKNFHLMHTSGIPVSINNSQMITLDNFEINGSPSEVCQISGEKSKNIRLTNFKQKLNNGSIRIDPKSDKKSISIK